MFNEIEEALETKLDSKYYGVVTNNIDPKKRDRIECTVLGISEDPIWCEQQAPLFKGTNAVNGFSGVPDIGQHVYIEFINGSPEQPIYTGLVRGASDSSDMQTSADDTVLHLPEKSRFIIKIGNTEFIMSKAGIVVNAKITHTGDTIQDGTQTSTGEITSGDIGLQAHHHEVEHDGTKISTPSKA